MRDYKSNIASQDFKSHAGIKKHSGKNFPECFFKNLFVLVPHCLKLLLALVLGDLLAALLFQIAHLELSLFMMN